MSAPQSEAFKAAVIDSKKLTSKPSNEDLLEIYALYKVGTGESFESATKPGMFDLKAGSPLPQRLGKAKYNAWSKLNDDSLTPEEAQAKYVAKIEEMKATYGYDADKQPEAVGASA
ncbi:putative fatty acid binding protein [Podospora appendiculata]|uniref:Fatty acid binding protein n=1 Tax=Podospora appendiculata TaxID=314037 RepID=A0AAE1CBC8_9PEZI|nr:putative fatty acid binding protein [Podospora appendiculata]